MANRSSVVRSLLGEGNTLSSSGLESSVKGEIELSLGVESVGKKSLHSIEIPQFPQMPTCNEDSKIIHRTIV